MQKPTSNTEDTEKLLQAFASVKSGISQILTENEALISTQEGKALITEKIYSLFLETVARMEADKTDTRRRLQAEGIKRAQKNGVHFGRELVYSADNYVSVLKEVESGSITNEQAMQKMGVGKTTYYRIKKELRKKGVLS